MSTLFLIGQNNSKGMESYVIEVTTFQFKSTIDADNFWIEDAKVEADYTSLQPGFISRESGYSPATNEVVVVVRWKTMDDAEASMQKFMGETSVMTYADMIDASTMKMNRYSVN